MTRFTPGVLAFYRGNATGSRAIQLKMTPPVCDPQDGWKPGVLMVEMTNGPKAFTYDWKNKLSFKLSLAEVTQIANWRNQPLSFKHDPNAKREGAGKITKTMDIKPAKDRGGVFIDMTSWTDKTKDKAHAIALSDDEFYAIRKICDRALTIIIGFEPEYLQAPAKRATAPVATTPAVAQSAAQTAPAPSAPVSRPAMPPRQAPARPPL